MRSGGDGRTAAVVPRQQRRIGGRLLQVLPLHGGGCHALLLGRHALLGGRCGRDAAGAAVVAHTSDVDVVDDRLVVGVMHHGDVDVGDRLVIGKGVSDPAAAGETHSAVSEAVIDAAVEADVRAPVAGVEHVHTADESPVT